MFRIELLIVILTLLLIDFFDRGGRLVGVGREGGLMKDKKLGRGGRGLLSECLGSIVGCVFGRSRRR